MAVCVMAAGVFLARAEEEVLWWQVPEDPDVTTLHEGVKSASSLGAVEARIRVAEGDTLGDYLVIPYEDDDLYSLAVPMVGGAWYAILPSSPEGLSFVVELGNWDDSTDSWVGIARSQSYTYAQLSNHIIRNWGTSGATTAQAPFVADSYAVPEPSSGLLLLIGGGLLALRRKRRG